MHSSLKFGVLLAAALLSACSGSATQSSIEPSISTPVNPATQTTLKFVVGTANIAGTLGLNTLETFRQSVGASAGASILLDAPTISGPAGFVVPNTTDAGGDAGKTTISGTVQTSLTSPPPSTTFNPSGSAASIASAYGFLPAASSNSQTVPDLIPASMPYYATSTGAKQFEYIGGPPAFVPPGHTSTQDGTFGTANAASGSYPGYTLGFNDFDATPVAGTYGLAVVVPTGVNSSGVSGYATVSASATLAQTSLPAWTMPPTFQPDGIGGGTITTGFSGGSAITEEYVELVNTGVPNGSGNDGYGCASSGAGPYYYTFKLIPGQPTLAVPDAIGPAKPGVAQPHTFCTGAENTAKAGTATVGDGWQVYGFAVDYPLYASAFPQSTGTVTPPIAGANGQADVTTSNASTGNVP